LPVVEGAPDTEHSYTYCARAIGSARSGNIEQARKEVAQLEALQKKLAPKKKNDQGEYESVSTDLTIARAWLAHAEGQQEEGLRLLRSIADKEEGEAESSQGIPAHEMIADMLLDSKRPQQALAEYEAALKSDPGRFNSLYGAAQAAEQAGDHQKASKYYSEVVKNCEGSQSERAELKHAREVVEAEAKASPRAQLR
jgi:tetratricopeptide (TPR) repeat protein